MAAKKIGYSTPAKGGKSKPNADRARAILKQRAQAKVMKKAEEQRRGMAASRAQQQKGRLTAEERQKVTQREKDRMQDEMLKRTAKKNKGSY